MVLVAGEYRRRGLATRLMRRAMDELAREGRIPILDATPDGPRRLSQRSASRTPGAFNGCIRRERAAHGGDRAGPPDIAVRAAHRCRLAGAVRLRRRRLRRRPQRRAGGLRGRLPAAELVAERAGRIAGFLLGRDGMRARHISVR